MATSYVVVYRGYEHFEVHSVYSVKEDAEATLKLLNMFIHPSLQYYSLEEFEDGVQPEKYSSSWRARYDVGQFGFPLKLEKIETAEAIGSFSASYSREYGLVLVDTAGDIVTEAVTEAKAVEALVQRAELHSRTIPVAPWDVDSLEVKSSRVDATDNPTYQAQLKQTEAEF